MKDKVIIKIEGGLVNQMFQFAFASILANSNKASLFLDLNFYHKNIDCTPRNFELDVFNVNYFEVTSIEISSFLKLSFFNKIKKKLGFNYPMVYQEPTYDFQEQALLLRGTVYIKGYFQSYKYFVNYENEIRAMFNFPLDQMDSVNNKMIITVLNLPNTVSIHIRRGDYVENTKTQQRHGNCSLRYYNDAINYLSSKIGDLNLFFFSDDINWVKSKFSDVNHSKIFIGNNKGTDSWKDMYLMSKSHHNIIANSSFSWWGAWLNNYPNKIVIAPKYWFNNVESSKDLIPENWITL